MKDEKKLPSDLPKNHRVSARINKEIYIKLKSCGVGIQQIIDQYCDAVIEPVELEIRIKKKLCLD